jgi:hypothetical protein
MTYNFDPERWYEMQRELLEARRASGEIDEPMFAKLLEELNQRYDEMVARLDGTFQIPERNSSQ